MTPNRVRNRTDLDGCDRSIGCNESFSWENPSKYAGFCDITGTTNETPQNGLMQLMAGNESSTASAALQPPVVAEFARTQVVNAGTAEFLRTQLQTQRSAKSAAITRSDDSW